MTTPNVVTVVGIGADGWAGLGPAGRDAVGAAEVVLGGPRQLDLVTEHTTAQLRAWPAPMLPALPGLFAELRGRRICALASGDPLLHGIGSTLIRVLGRDRVAVLPHPSSVSLACARLRWPAETVDVVSAVARPMATVLRVLGPGRRLLVLGADPADLAGLLVAAGWGTSALTVLEQLGGPDERCVEGTADGWSHPPGDPLRVIAVEVAAVEVAAVEVAGGAAPIRAPRVLRADAGTCARGRLAARIDAVAWAEVPGLPDHAYEHDGQLTKREIRAVTLALLGPRPGEQLWDVGAGAGSVGIEWCRAHPRCAATAVESRPDRAARVAANAEALGVPGLRVVTGRAPQALQGLPEPDAVFVGGGVTGDGVLDACWAALRPGGRLVANAVTLEAEAVLIAARGRRGGELTRLAVHRAEPVGGFTGWRPSMPVTIWSVTKGAGG